MSSSSYGVLETWQNSMSSWKFWKILSTLLTLHFVSILIPLFCYLSVEIEILSKSVLWVLIVIFYKKSVFIRSQSYRIFGVGVGYTDFSVQMSPSFQVVILILRCNPRCIRQDAILLSKPHILFFKNFWRQTDRLTESIITTTTCRLKIITVAGQLAD